MDLVELDATLRRLGLPDHQSQMGGGWERVGRDRASLIVQNDRSPADVVDFGSEDALCRWLLTRSLLAQPPAARRVPRAPRLLPPSVAPDRAHPGQPGDPPGLRWERAFAPLSRLAARGAGVVITEDTGSLLARGGDGALVQQVIEVTTGRVRWARPVWPPAATPTVGVADDCLLSWAHGRLTGHDLTSGEERWQVRARQRPRLLAYAPGRAVLTTGGVADAQLAAWGIDLADGRTVWKETTSDPVYALAGPEARTALHRIEQRKHELVLSEITVDDGARRVLTRVPCPSGYRGAHLMLLFHERDERGELALVRGRAERRQSDVGTRLGDLVLLVDRDELVVIDPEPDLDRHRFTAGADAGHLLHLPTLPQEGTTTLFSPAEGRELWARPGGGKLVHRRPGLTILTTRADGPRTVAIDDGGQLRWSAPGAAVVVRAEEVWLSGEDGLLGVGLEDGAERWRAPRPSPAPIPWSAPNGRSGYREDDGHVVWTSDDRLLALGSVA